MPDSAKNNLQNPNRKNRFVAKLAPFLPAIILSSPFLLFVKFNNYGLIKFETVII